MKTINLHLETFFKTILSPTVLETIFTTYLILQLFWGCPYSDQENVFSWLSQNPFSTLFFKYVFCLAAFTICLQIVSFFIQNTFLTKQRVTKRLHPLAPSCLLRLTALLFFSAIYAMVEMNRFHSFNGYLAMLSFFLLITIYIRNTVLKNKPSQELESKSNIPHNNVAQNTRLQNNHRPLSRKGCVLVLCFGVFLTLFISLVTVFRYLRFWAPGFDFGIFTQMFEQMRRTGLPVTTYERDGLLSHFAVHFSPAFYLMLPVYQLFPYPETLQILQALILAAGLFPLMKLSARMGLQENHRILLAIAYCCYPALSGGCFYDLHENCFLTVFLLFQLLAMESDSWPGIIISTLLICSVKEDAPFFAICTGLYYLFSGRRRVKGFWTVFLSASWMLVAIWYLEHFGQGSMISRFSNLLYPADGNMIDVVKTILLCPGYALVQCFQEEKLSYLIILLIPLAFAPILIQEISELFLCLPIFLINLMSNYPYQHDIYFQYSFGATAILFFLFMKHYSSISKNFRQTICLLAALASIFSFEYYNWDRFSLVMDYPKYTNEIETMEKAIQLLPKDASVQASAFFVPHLYQWNELYALESQHTADYVILDLRCDSEMEKNYQNNCWKLIDRQDGITAIYQNISQVP